MSIELSGKVESWGLGESPREYMLLTLPYGQARHILRSDPYNALSAKGEQRMIVCSHARALKREMENGAFTPTPMHAGVRQNHLKSLTYQTHKGVRMAHLTLEENGVPLPLTNGGHRMEALAMIHKEASERVARSRGEEKKDAEQYLLKVEEQPVSFLLLLGGDTQVDFVNLQRGKKVDASHVLAIQINRQLTNQKEAEAMKLAFSTAKAIAGNSQNPFYRQIRFDSKGTHTLTLATLCSKSPSDLSSSLVGMAKIGLAFDRHDAAHLAAIVIKSCQLIEQEARELLAPGRLLTPPPNGTRGSATMLIGVALQLAYRMFVTMEGGSPSERTRGQLISALRAHFDHEVNGSFAGPFKRGMLGQLAREFFCDLEMERHDGIPLGLLKILPPSTFAAASLPRPERSRKKKVLPDIESGPPSMATDAASPSEDSQPAEATLPDLTDEPQAKEDDGIPLGVEIDA